MIRNRRSRRRRRGIILLECSFAYSVVFLLTLGTIVVGFGVFRYQEMAWLAQEGARWAAVHGPKYQSEQGQPMATNSTVMSNAIAPRMVILTPGSLNCNLAPMSSGVATVTLTFTWIPEAYLGSVTLTATASMPITY